VTAGFPGLDELFEGRHFDREIIVLCVRWYLRFKLSFREPGGDDGRTRPADGSQHHHAVAPSLCSGVRASLEPVCAAGRAVAARRRDLRENPWQVGLLVQGRAVDRDGKTVDFRLSTRRDVAAAKAFFRKAIKSQGSTPKTITLYQPPKSLTLPTISAVGIARRVGGRRRAEHRLVRFVSHLRRRRVSIRRALRVSSGAIPPVPHRLAWPERLARHGNSLIGRHARIAVQRGRHGDEVAVQVCCDEIGRSNSETANSQQFSG
jgi:hypothetical protein